MKAYSDRIGTAALENSFLLLLFSAEQTFSHFNQQGFFTP